MKNNLLIKSILFVFLFLTTISNQIWASDFNPEILAELKKSPVQRFYIENTRGLGHQSHTMLMIRRLRSAGYKGKIEVIYHSQAKEKIETLFPIVLNKEVTFDPSNNMVFINKYSIQRFVTGPHVQSHNYQIVPLDYCLSGGLDHKLADSAFPKIDLYNCKAMIALNPQGWDRPSFIEIFDKQEETHDLNSLIDLVTYPTDYLFEGELVNQDLVRWLAELSLKTKVLPFYSHKNHKTLLLQRLTTALIKSYPRQTHIIPIFNRMYDVELNLICDECNEDTVVWIRPYEKPVAGKINLVYVDHVNPATYKRIFTSKIFPLVFVSGRNSIAEVLFSGQPFIEAQERFYKSFFTRNANILNYKFYLTARMRAIFYSLNLEFQALNVNFDSDKFASLLKSYLDSDSGRTKLHQNFAEVFQSKADKLNAGLRLAFEYLRSKEILGPKTNPQRSLPQTLVNTSEIISECSLFLR